MRSEFESVVTVPTVDRELGAAPPLLERDRRRQPGDLVDLRAPPPWFSSRRAYGATDSK